MKSFYSNLKATFKFISLVVPTLAVLIAIDSFKSDDYSNIILLAYLAALLPVVVISVAIYTKLKNSNLNKLICAILFSLSTIFASIIWYIAAWFLDGSELDLGFISRFSAMMFVAFIWIYYELPWRKHGL